MPGHLRQTLPGSPALHSHGWCGHRGPVTPLCFMSRPSINDGLTSDHWPASCLLPLPPLGSCAGNIYCTRGNQRRISKQPNKMLSGIQMILISRLSSHILTSSRVEKLKEERHYLVPDVFTFIWHILSIFNIKSRKYCTEPIYWEYWQKE